VLEKDGEDNLVVFDGPTPPSNEEVLRRVKEERNILQTRQEG
jgi:hypothetical protein